MRFNAAIAFGVKRDGVDRRPVSRVARPTRRGQFAGLCVQGVTCRQDRVILPGMTLRGTDVPNAAMPVIDVVPLHEMGGPSAGVVEDRVGRLVMADADRIGGVLEEIDRRRAPELEMAGPQRLRQTVVPFAVRVLAQKEMKAQGVTRVLQVRMIESGQIDEEKLVRESEVLAEQAIADEGAVVVIEQAVVGGKADRGERTGRQRDGVRRGFGAVGHADLDGAHEQEFVEQGHQPRIAVEEEAQAVQADRADRQSVERLQVEADDGGGLRAQPAQIVGVLGQLKPVTAGSSHCFCS